MLKSVFKDWSRFWLQLALAAGIVVACGAFLRFHAPTALPARYLPLTELPLRIRQWQGRTLPIAPDIRAVLGPGQFIERLYRRSGVSAPVDLFLAFFPSQRTGDTIHSPKNCLPAGGWVPISSSHLSLTGSTGKPFLVNRYLVAKGRQRILVLYWFDEQGRTAENEYLAKVYLVENAIHTNRTDGALIRVATPLAPREATANAQRRLVSFTERVLPVLHAYVP